MIERWPPAGELLELWREGRLDESAALLKRLAEEDPGAPEVPLLGALQLLKEDDYRLSPSVVWRVSGLVTEAVARFPGDAYVLLTGATIMQDVQDYHQSALYVRALRDRADQLPGVAAQALLAFVIGRLAHWRGIEDLAEEQLRVAVELDPGESDYAAPLVRLLHKQGRLDEARAVLTEALRKAPHSMELLDLDRELVQSRGARKGSS